MMTSKQKRRISVLPEGCGVACLSGALGDPKESDECEELRVEHLHKNQILPAPCVADSDDDDNDGGDPSDSALTTALNALFCAGAYGRSGDAAPVMAGSLTALTYRPAF